MPNIRTLHNTEKCLREKKVASEQKKRLIELVGYVGIMHSCFGKETSCSLLIDRQYVQ